MEDLAKPWNYQNWWVGTGMEMILCLGQYSTQNNIVCSSQLVHIGTYFVHKETFWASKINSKVYTQGYTQQKQYNLLAYHTHGNRVILWLHSQVFRAPAVVLIAYCK